MGEIYSVRLQNRPDNVGIRTGQVVYSVQDHVVKLRSEEGNSILYIYPQDELEFID